MMWFDYTAGFIAGLVTGIMVMTPAKSEELSEIPLPNAAYCALYAREAVRIDIMHTLPVSRDEANSQYPRELARKVFAQCLTVVPALLPLPEEHRQLDTWAADMATMIEARLMTLGAAPATDAPAVEETSDEEAWRFQCRAEYRSWDEETGTVVRRGSSERVKCPCGSTVQCVQ